MKNGVLIESKRVFERIKRFVADERQAGTVQLFVLLLDR